MSPHIQLSILTPYKFRSHWIDRCIDNFLSQECQQAEHIIIVDKDDEKSYQAALRASLKSPSTTVVQQEKTGLANALNHGTHIANGEIISILNIDDFYEPGILNRIISLNDSLTLSHVVVGNVKVIDGKGSLLSWNKPESACVTSWHLGAPFPWNPTGYFYPKRLHEQIGFYDSTYTTCVDLEFLCRASKSMPFKFFDEHWGNHRKIPDTITMKALENNTYFSVEARVYQTHLTFFQKLYCMLYQKNRKWRSLVRKLLRRAKDK